MQDGVVKVRDGAVSGFAIPRIAKVAVARFEAASQITEDEEGPFKTLGMMAFSVVAEVDHESIVEHGAVAFWHGVELLEEGRERLGVAITNGDVESLGSLAAERSAVADAMKADGAGGKAEVFAIDFDAGKLSSAAGGDGDNIGHARDEAAGGDAELRIEVFKATGSGREFCGVEGFAAFGNTLTGFDEFGLSLAHRFKGLEVEIELLFLRGVEIGLKAANVIGEEIEDVGFGIKSLSGITGGGSGENTLIGQERLALRRECFALVPRTDIVDHVVVGPSRYTESEVWKNSGMGLGEDGIDCFAEGVVALRVATECPKVG